MDELAVALAHFKFNENLYIWLRQSNVLFEIDVLLIYYMLPLKPRMYKNEANLYKQVLTRQCYSVVLINNREGEGDFIVNVMCEPKP